MPDSNSTSKGPDDVGEGRDGFDDVRITVDVKCSLLKLGIDVVDGFESVVLEDCFPYLVPQIFLRVQVGGIGWEKMQHDIGRDLEPVAMMIAGTIHKQQDELPGALLGQWGQKNRETFRIGRRHDQIDASSVLRADPATEADVFSNALGGNLRPDPDANPARSHAAHPPKP